MTLPVSLAAAAVTLRAEAEKPLTRFCEEHWSWLCTNAQGKCQGRLRAVADLIDGMLAIWSEAVDRYERYELGAQSGADAMEDVVALLVPLVRAFLPDWNPDTEETP